MTRLSWFVVLLLLLTVVMSSVAADLLGGPLNPFAAPAPASPTFIANWSHTINQNHGPMVKDNSGGLYFTQGSGASLKILSVEALSGYVFWTTPVGCPLFPGTPPVSSLKGFALSDNILALVCADMVIALDIETGTPMWNTSFPDIYVINPPNSYEYSPTILVVEAGRLLVSVQNTVSMKYFILSIDLDSRSCTPQVFSCVPGGSQYPTPISYMIDTQTDPENGVFAILCNNYIAGLMATNFTTVWNISQGLTEAGGFDSASFDLNFIDGFLLVVATPNSGAPTVALSIDLTFEGRGAQLQWTHTFDLPHTIISTACAVTPRLVWVVVAASTVIGLSPLNGEQLWMQQNVEQIDGAAQLHYKTLFLRTYGVTAVDMDTGIVLWNHEKEYQEDGGSTINIMGFEPFWTPPPGIPDTAAIAIATIGDTLHIINVTSGAALSTASDLGGLLFSVPENIIVNMLSNVIYGMEMTQWGWGALGSSIAISAATGNVFSIVDVSSSQSSFLSAFTASGAAAWRTSVEYTNNGQYDSTSIFAFGDRFVAHVAAAEYIEFLSALDGSLVASAHIGTSCHDPKQPSVGKLVPSGDQLFFTAGTYCLYKIDASLVLSTVSLDFTALLTPFVDEANGLVYVAQSARVVAVRADTLAVTWTYISERAITNVQGIGRYTYIITSASIVCIDAATGKVVWSERISVAVSGNSPLLEFNGAAFTVTNDGIACIDLNPALTTPHLKWVNRASAPPVDSTTTNLVATPDGVVYGTVLDTFYALRASDGTPVWTNNSTFTQFTETVECTKLLAVGYVLVSNCFGVVALDARTGHTLFSVLQPASEIAAFGSTLLFAAETYSVGGFAIPSLPQPTPSPAPSVPLPDNTVPPGFVPPTPVPVPLTPFAVQHQPATQFPLYLPGFERLEGDLLQTVPDAAGRYAYVLYGATGVVVGTDPLSIIKVDAVSTAVVWNTSISFDNGCEPSGIFLLEGPPANVVVCQCNNHLFAFDLDNGSQRWSFYETNLISTVTPGNNSGSNANVYVLTQGNTVDAISAINGSLLYTIDPAAFDVMYTESFVVESGPLPSAGGARNVLLLSGGSYVGVFRADTGAVVMQNTTTIQCINAPATGAGAWNAAGTAFLSVCQNTAGSYFSLYSLDAATGAIALQSRREFFGSAAFGAIAISAYKNTVIVYSTAGFFVFDATTYGLSRAFAGYYVTPLTIVDDRYLFVFGSEDGGTTNQLLAFDFYNLPQGLYNLTVGCRSFDGPMAGQFVDSALLPPPLAASRQFIVISAGSCLTLIDHTNGAAVWFYTVSQDSVEIASVRQIPNVPGSLLSDMPGLSIITTSGASRVSSFVFLGNLTYDRTWSADLVNPSVVLDANGAETGDFVGSYLSSVVRITADATIVWRTEIEAEGSENSIVIVVPTPLALVVFTERTILTLKPDTGAITKVFAYPGCGGAEDGETTGVYVTTVLPYGTTQLVAAASGCLYKINFVTGDSFGLDIHTVETVNNPAIFGDVFVFTNDESAHAIGVDLRGSMSMAWESTKTVSEAVASEYFYFAATFKALLVAFDIQTGEVVWTFQLPYVSALGYYNGVLLVQSRNLIYSLNTDPTASNRVRWVTTLPRNAALTSNVLSIVFTTTNLAVVSCYGSTYGINVTDGAVVWGLKNVERCTNVMTTPAGAPRVVDSSGLALFVCLGLVMLSVNDGRIIYNIATPAASLTELRALAVTESSLIVVGGYLLWRTPLLSPANGAIPPPLPSASAVPDQSAPPNVTLAPPNVTYAPALSVTSENFEPVALFSIPNPHMSSSAFLNGGFSFTTQDRRRAVVLSSTPDFDTTPLTLIDLTSARVLRSRKIPYGGCLATAAFALSSSMGAYYCSGRNSITAFHFDDLSDAWTTTFDDVPGYSLDTGAPISVYNEHGIACIARQKSYTCLNVTNGERTYLYECNAKVTAPPQLDLATGAIILMCLRKVVAQKVWGQVVAVSPNGSQTLWYVAMPPQQNPDTSCDIIPRIRGRRLLTCDTPIADSLYTFSVYDIGSGQRVGAVNVTEDLMSYTFDDDTLAVGGASLLVYSVPQFQRLWTLGVSPLVTTYTPLLANGSYLFTTSTNDATTTDQYQLEVYDKLSGNFAFNISVGAFRTDTLTGFDTAALPELGDFIIIAGFDTQTLIDVGARTFRWATDNPGLDTFSATFGVVRHTPLPWLGCVLVVTASGRVNCFAVNSTAWTYPATNFGVDPATQQTLLVFSGMTFLSSANGSFIWSQAALPTLQTYGLTVDPLFVTDGTSGFRAFVIITTSAVLVQSAETGRLLSSTGIPDCNGEDPNNEAVEPGLAVDGTIAFVTATTHCLLALDTTTGLSRTITGIHAMVGTPVVSSNCILVWDNTGQVYCFSRDSPLDNPAPLLWATTAGFFHLTPPITVFGSLVIVGVESAVTAIDEVSGIIVWTHRVGARPKIAVGNGAVFAITFETMTALAASIDATQRVAWVVDITLPPNSAAAATTATVSAPLVTPEGIVLAFVDISLFGWNATTGELLYTVNTGTLCINPVYFAETGVVVAACSTGVRTFDPVSGAPWLTIAARSSGLGSPFKVVSADYVVSGAYSASLVQGTRVSLRPAGRVPPATVAPVAPPTGTLPPHFTPAGEFTGVATLPPGAALPSLSCVASVERGYTPLVSCLQNVVTSTWANGPATTSLNCLVAAIDIASCRDNFANALPRTGCNYGVVQLQQVLSAANASAAFAFARDASLCSGGAKEAALVQTALTVPGLAPGETLPSWFTFPAPGNAVPTFTIPPGPATGTAPPATTTSPGISPPPPTVTPQPSATGTAQPGTVAPTPPPSTAPPTGPIDQFACIAAPGSPLDVTVFSLSLKRLLTTTYLPQLQFLDVSADKMRFTFIFTGSQATTLSAQLQDEIAADPQQVQGALRLASIVATPYAPPTSAPPQPAPSKLSPGATAGIIVGCLIVGGVIAAAIYQFVLRGRTARGGVGGLLQGESSGELRSLVGSQRSARQLNTENI